MFATTLFVYPDWARQSASPRDSEEYRELACSAQKTIDVSSSRPCLLRVLCTMILPRVLFTYAILAFLTNLYRLSSFRLSTSFLVDGKTALPCFLTVPISRSALLVLDGSSSAVAVLGLVTSVALMARCSIGRAYLSFVASWSRANSEFVAWCVISSVLQVVIRGTAGVSSSLVVFLNPPIFAGIDFLVLLTGRDKWALRFFNLFFVLNVLAIGLGYAASITRCAWRRTSREAWPWSR